MLAKSTLAQIHIAKKDLQISDIIYRDCINAISDGKTESSKYLNPSQAQKLLKHFKSIGWQPKYHNRKLPQSPSGHLKLLPKTDPAITHIVRLWHLLAKKGKLQNSSRKAMLNFCERQTSQPVKNLDQLSTGEKQKIIESLKAWHARK